MLEDHRAVALKVFDVFEPRQSDAIRLVLDLPGALLRGLRLVKQTAALWAMNGRVRLYLVGAVLLLGVGGCALPVDRPMAFQDYRCNVTAKAGRR